jgi:Flavodoxin
MDVAIVYESLFGNTRAVAEAIADGVRDADPAAYVALMRVSEAKADPVGRAQLLVVGGPTHMRGMTSGATRRKGLAEERKAAQSARVALVPEAGAAGPGIRDWFGALPRARPGAHAAAFDTRADFRLAGGAARKISRRLRRHGYDLVGRPEGFVIEATDGPLRPGERDKARAWGAALVRELRRAA